MKALPGADRPEDNKSKDGVCRAEPVDHISIGHIPNRHGLIKRNTSIGTADDSWLMVMFHAGSFSRVDNDEVRL